MNDSLTFNVNLSNYSGPLEVLLDLAKSQKVDLEKIGSTGYVAGGPSAWIKRSNQILNQDPYKIQKKK